ncbi:corticotropin-releasing factor receptor 1-like isoform X2 [Paramacrobiotus metropolitanus]|uniref:corticotropin-releasing factor receptor 1-like isoform X2 n=1 Tax=Paramacrobiotus metropolitanus TaxID=2943436 RepID=UPI002445DECD|nr:corticotropin-releasing factor receptor 1-like isoform X2 [Paramacrobiotus metropolitanus]
MPEHVSQHRTATSFKRLPLLRSDMGFRLLLASHFTWSGSASGVPHRISGCSLRYEIYLSVNATRYCFFNGTWANLSDYDACTNNTINLFPVESDSLVHMGVIGIYYIGYSISFISSCVALWLFIYFRTLHCLRNTLHCNLIITYILVDVTWIIMTSIITHEPTEVHAFGKSVTDETYRFDCRLTVAFFNYFQVTNFFWMLVEGLYIILIIFRTHKLELLCYWPFAIIGWGLPICVITAWMTVKIVLDDKECWINTSSPYNFIYIGPILLVLAVNVIFLCTIMHILLRKYRGTTTTVISTRRTAKSFLILLPLLGITYVLVLVIPREAGPLRTSLDYVNAIATSLQGFFVSLLYCFLNNEVRAIIRLRGNSFFPYRTWLKLDTSATRRSPRSLTTSADGPPTGNNNGDTMIVQQPPALFRYRQNENLRRLQINTITANKNEVAYLLKEKEHQNRIQKQIRHQAMGYRSTVF